jgi:hypothetical protein
MREVCGSRFAVGSSSSTISRLVHQRTRQRELLLHPLREQPGAVAPPIPEIERAQHQFGGQRGARHAEQPRVDADIVEHGEVVPQARRFP